MQLGNNIVHLSKKMSTVKRRLARFHLFSSTKLSSLQHERDNLIEQDKVFFLFSFYSVNNNHSIKLLNQISSTIRILFIFQNDLSTAENNKGKFITFFLSGLKPESFVFQKEEGFSAIPFSDMSFSETDPKDLLHNVPDTSAVAADVIPLFVLRQNAKVLSPIIYIVFSQIISCCFWTKIWKEACVIPLQKSKSKSDVTNYRGISIFLRLSLLLKKKNFFFVLSIPKFGISCLIGNRYLQKRSFLTQNLGHIDKIYSCNDVNEDFFAVYLDKQKEFDNVSHNFLLNKLTVFVFVDAIIRLISSYLLKGIQRVPLNQYLSSEGHVSSTVPQDSILGPQHFLICIKDLPDVVNHSIPYLFADDLKLL